MSNTTDTNTYQTYLKDCGCSNGGIIIYEGKAVCRWCRKPYGNGGQMHYLPEHFEASKQTKQERIKVGKMSCLEGEPGYGQMKWNLQFKTNKHIHYEKAIYLCNLLERYLNGEMDNPAPTPQPPLYKEQGDDDRRMDSRTVLLIKEVLDYFDMNTTKVPPHLYKALFNSIYPPKSSPIQEDKEVLPFFYEVDRSTWKIIETQFHHYTDYFNTRIEAEQFVLENKPCLSTNDIKWWLEKYFDYPNCINVNQLKELVQQKISQ